MSLSRENELLPASFAHEDVDMTDLCSIALCDENEAYYDSILIELNRMCGSIL